MSRFHFVFSNTKRKCVILSWNFDNFNHWDNKQLNAGVFVVYINYIYLMGAGQVFVISDGQSKASRQ